MGVVVWVGIRGVAAGGALPLLRTLWEQLIMLFFTVMTLQLFLVKIRKISKKVLFI